MRRIGAGWILGSAVACAGVIVALTAAPASADPVDAHPAVTEPGVVPVPPRPAPHGPTRLRVYRTFPGPNAVRECETNYVQEFRQAGTVIVPRIHCWWTPG